MDKKKIFDNILSLAEELKTEGSVLTKSDLASELMKLGIIQDSLDVGRIVAEAYNYFGNNESIKKAFSNNEGTKSIVEDYVLSQFRKNGQHSANEELSTYSEEEKEEMEPATQCEEKRQLKKSQRQEEIEQSTPYKIVRGTSFVMDKCCLDPIFDFILPEFGDVITSITVLPSVYVSAFVVRSFPLTLTIISNMMFDALVGLVPLLGDVGDYLYRSNTRNFELIVGYVEGDKEIKAKVRKRAVWTAIFIVIMGILIYLLGKLFYGFAIWAIGLIRSGIDFIIGLF